jgi:putative transcriptional regulator
MAFGMGRNHTMTARKKATPKTGDNNLAKKIRDLRSKLGLTQEQFAAKVGVTFSTVNRWESGKSKPSPLALKMIEKLARRVQGSK